MRFVSLNYLSEAVKLNCIVDELSTCRHMAFEIIMRTYLLQPDDG